MENFRDQLAEIRLHLTPRLRTRRIERKKPQVSTWSGSGRTAEISKYDANIKSAMFRSMPSGMLVSVAALTRRARARRRAGFSRVHHSGLLENAYHQF